MGTDLAQAGIGDVEEGSSPPVSETEGAQRQRRQSFKVLTISQLAGASNAMSTDNLIGLSYYLQHNPSETPDILNIIGGLIPEIPDIASKRKKYKLLSLKEGIQNIYDAAAKMKPHIERIERQLPSESLLIYTHGVSDRNNTDDLDLRIQLAYAFDPMAIEDFLLDTIEASDTKEETIRSCVTSLQEIVKSPAFTKDDDMLLEAENLRVKLRINREQFDELLERQKLLTKLYGMQAEKLTKDELQELQTERKEQKELLEEQKKRLEEGSLELKKLMAEEKKVTNSLSRIEKRLQEGSFAAVSEEVQSKTREVTRFAHNPRTPPDVMKVIHAVSKSFYTSTLKDVFGRKRDVILQEEKIMVYPLKNGSFRVNVIVGRELGQLSSMLSKNSNAYPAQVLNRYIENSEELLKYRLEDTPINLLVSGHFAYTSRALELLRSESKSLLVTLEQGPFWRSNGQRGVATDWNKGMITEETRSVERTLIDVGATMVTIGRDQSIIIDSLKERMLRDQRALSDIEEREAVKKLFASVKDPAFGEAGKSAADSSIEIKEDLEVAVAKSRRPSELRQRDAAWLNKKTLVEMVPYMNGPEPIPAARYRFADLSDIHIGGWAKEDVIDAYVKYLKQLEPDFLIFGGDILEGNRGNKLGFKNTIKEANDPEIDLQRPHTRVIQNVDSQDIVFMQHFGELIFDVLKRGGSIVIASGNHYNNTTADDAHDEATRLRNDIKMYLMREGQNGALPEGWESRIKVARGTEQGSASFRVKDEFNDFWVTVTHRGAASKSGMVNELEKRKTESLATFSHDLHNAQQAETLNHVFTRGLSIQDASQDNYLKGIKVPTSTRGINGGVVQDVYAAMDEYGKSRLVRQTTELVTENSLIAKGLQKPSTAYEKALDEEKTIHLKSTQRKHAAPVLVKSR